MSENASFCWRGGGCLRFLCIVASFRLRYTSRLFIGLREQRIAVDQVSQVDQSGNRDAGLVSIKKCRTNGGIEHPGWHGELVRFTQPDKQSQLAEGANQFDILAVEGMVMVVNSDRTR